MHAKLERTSTYLLGVCNVNAAEHVYVCVCVCIVSAQCYCMYYSSSLSFSNSIIWSFCMTRQFHRLRARARVCVCVFIANSVRLRLFYDFNFHHFIINFCSFDYSAFQVDSRQIDMGCIDDVLWIGCGVSHTCPTHSIDISWMAVVGHCFRSSYCWLNASNCVFNSFIRNGFPKCVWSILWFFGFQPLYLSTSLPRYLSSWSILLFCFCGILYFCFSVFLVSDLFRYYLSLAHTHKLIKANICVTLYNMIWAHKFCYYNVYVPRIPDSIGSLRFMYFVDFLCCCHCRRSKFIVK